MLGSGLSMPLRANRYFVAFLEGDDAGMNQQLEWAKGKFEAEATLLYYAGQTLAFHGRFTRARTLTEEAQTAAEHGDGRRRVSEYDVGSAWREAEVGNLALARQYLAKAPTSGVNRDEGSMTAIALATAGDIPAATRLADELNRKYPSDTRTQDYVLPAVRALVELKLGKPSIIGRHHKREVSAGQFKLARRLQYLDRVRCTALPAKYYGVLTWY